MVRGTTLEILLISEELRFNCDGCNKILIIKRFLAWQKTLYIQLDEKLDMSIFFVENVFHDFSVLTCSRCRLEHRVSTRSICHGFVQICHPIDSALVHQEQTL